MSTIKWIALLTFFLFVGYSFYCGRKEPFWKVLKKVLSLYWGRQFVIDLYIGFFLFGFFIYLIEDSLLTTLLWLVPSLAFGNMVTLIYLFTHFEAIISKFS